MAGNKKLLEMVHVQSQLILISIPIIQKKTCKERTKKNCKSLMEKLVVIAIFTLKFLIGLVVLLLYSSPLILASFSAYYLTMIERDV